MLLLIQKVQVARLFRLLSLKGSWSTDGTTGNGPDFLKHREEQGRRVDGAGGKFDGVGGHIGIVDGASGSLVAGLR